MTQLVLLRHGETVGQSSIRLYGATDIALSPIGEQQVARAAAALAPHRFTRILTSPLQRARRSAEIVRAALDPPPPLETVADFREVDFGAWEGWTYAEAEARDPDNYRRWHAEGPAFTYPNGESRADFHARVGAAARLLAPGDLVVVHKGVIRTLLAALTDQTPADLAGLAIPLGSIHRLRRDDAGWQLVATGETAHLGDLDLGG